MAQSFLVPVHIHLVRKRYNCVVLLLWSRRIIKLWEKWFKVNTRSFLHLSVFCIQIKIQMWLNTLSLYLHICVSSCKINIQCYNSCKLWRKDCMCWNPSGYSFPVTLYVSRKTATVLVYFLFNFSCIPIADRPSRGCFHSPFTDIVKTSHFIWTSQMEIKENCGTVRDGEFFFFVDCLYSSSCIAKDFCTSDVICLSEPVQSCQSTTVVQIPCADSWKEWWVNIWMVGA